MNFWKKLFGGKKEEGNKKSDGSYNCRSCGRKTTGYYMIVGTSEPLSPPYYGGAIYKNCSQRLGAI